MLTQIFDQLINFLVSTIGNMGYLGIFILMALESSIIPVPSELVLIPAGFLAFEGSMSIFWIVVISVLGGLFGSLASYYVALLLGRKLTDKLIGRYGKIFFLSEEHLVKTEKYFENHGEITVFIGRLIPGVRHLISLPAGFSRMKLSKFCFYTALGAGLWAIILTYLGYFFKGNLDVIKSNLDIITIFVVFFCTVGILIYVYHRLKKRKMNYVS